MYLGICRYLWKVILDTGNNDCLWGRGAEGGKGGFLFTLYPVYVSNPVPWSPITYE